MWIRNRDCQQLFKVIHPILSPGTLNRNLSPGKGSIIAVSFVSFSPLMYMPACPTPASENHVLFCGTCEKPFAKGRVAASLTEGKITNPPESSWKRHIAYCSRSQRRPRIRSQACQPCNAAKTKCSLETQCQRCKRKNIACTYSRRVSVSHNQVPQSARSVAPISLGLDQPGSLSTRGTHPDISIIQDEVIDPINIATANTSNPALSHQDVPLDDTWNLLPLEASSTDLALALSRAVSSNGLPWNLPSSSYRYQSPNLGYDLACSTLEYFPLEFGLRDWDKFPEIPYLKPLIKTDRVAQHYALMVIRTLRGYPHMMLQQDTFPPFIHSKVYGASDSDSGELLSAPLANCMRIAEMFALRTAETRPFLWHTISEEIKTLLCNVSPTLLAHLEKQKQKVDLTQTRHPSFQNMNYSPRFRPV